MARSRQPRPGQAAHLGIYEQSEEPALEFGRKAANAIFDDAGRSGSGRAARGPRGTVRRAATAGAPRSNAQSAGPGESRGGRTRPPWHCSVGPTALSRESSRRSWSSILRSDARSGQVAVGSVRLAGQHGRQPEPPCTPSRRVVRHGVGASGKAVIDDSHGDFSPPTSRWLRYPPQSTSISSPGGHHAERPAHLHWQPANLQQCGAGGRRRANRRHLRALLAQYRSESRYPCQGGCAQRGGRGRVCTGSSPARADHQMRSGIASAQRRLEARQRRIVQPGQVENQADAMSVGKIG